MLDRVNTLLAEAYNCKLQQNIRHVLPHGKFAYYQITFVIVNLLCVSQS